MSGKLPSTSQRIAEQKAIEKRQKAVADDIVSDLKLSGDRKKKACFKDVLKAIWEMERQSDLFNGRYVDLADTTKRSLRRFAKTVETLERVWNTTPLFPLDVPIESIEKVLEFGRECQRIANAKGKPPRKDAALKRHAARYAHALLIKYGVRPTAHTKASTYCKVAKRLYEADPTNRSGGHDLLSQCKAHIRERD